MNGETRKSGLGMGARGDGVVFGVYSLVWFGLITMAAARGRAG